MSDLEETRKKIGIDSLDRDTREKLFREFVRSGGRVLSERELIRQKLRERLTKEKEAKRQKEDLAKHSAQGVVKPSVREQVVGTWRYVRKVDEKKGEDLVITIFDRIKVFFEAYLQGVISISGFLKKRFFEKTFRDVPSAFLDLRIVSYLLTRKDEKFTTAVKKSLNVLNPVGYEIVYRLNDFPSDEVFSKIDRMYRIFAQTRTTVRPSEVKSILKYIFKKLYLMYPYRDQARVLVSTALRAISPYIPRGDFQKTEKLFYKAWDFLFEEYFPKLRVAINFLIGKELSLSSEHLIRFLEVKEEDYVGYLTEKVGISKVEEEPKEEKVQKEDYKEKQESPVDEGIRILNEIDVRKIQNSIRRKDIYVDYTDKVFISEALVEFYEKHIYPVLVLKSRYSIVFESARTFDVKKVFDDIYASIRTLRDRMSEYYRVVGDYNTIESDVMVPISKKSSLLNSRSMEMSRLSYQIRKELGEILGKVKNNLEIVLSDYRAGGSIVINPQEKIEFQVDKMKDVEVERNFFEGEKVIDALERIFKIVSALVFLFTDGDLGGSNIKLEKPVYLNIRSF